MAGERGYRLLKPANDRITASKQATVQPWRVVLEQLRTCDLDFADDNRKRDIHSTHPYPAKFTAALPAAILDAILAGPCHVVDPFCGSGTTLVEALRRGCAATGFDANEIALLIARAKTSRLTSRDRKALLDAVQELQSGIALPQEEGNVPVLARNKGRTRFWFPSHGYQELRFIQRLGEHLLTAAQRTVWETALSAIMVRMSHQDDETRYAWVEKEFAPWGVFEAFRGKLASTLEACCGAATEYEAARAGECRIAPIDYSNGPQTLGHDLFDCAVFSPPYPNTFDYHLYHRLRLLFFGHDPSALRRMEMGAHLKYEPDTQIYLRGMRHALQSLLAALRPGGMAAMVVGDSIVRGRQHDNASDLRTLAEAVGFQAIGTLKRGIPAHRKSFTRSAERLREESIVLIGKPPEKTGAEEHPHQAALFSCAYPLQTTEQQLAGEFYSLAQDHPECDHLLLHGPFFHSVKLADGSPARTFQASIDSAGGKFSKCTSYFGHGLHPYVGKFYPQIARQLLLNDIARRRLCPREVAVIDPFCGSGTTLVESCIVGARVTGIELNPVAALVSHAKLQLLRASLRATTDQVSALLDAVGMLRADATQSAWKSEERVAYLRSWFPSPQLCELSALYRLLKERFPSPLEDGAVYYALLSSILRICSLQRPSDLRIRRRDPEEVSVSPFPAFRARLVGLLHDLQCWDRASALLHGGVREAALHSEIRCGDTLDITPVVADERRGTPTCIVTSPPYAAALPYIDTDRLSLAVLELDALHGEQRSLERRMIGNREITTAERRRGVEAIRRGDHRALGSPTLNDFLETMCQDLESAGDKAGFRRLNNPAIVLAYFQALHGILGSLSRLEKGTAFFLLIAGNHMHTGKRALFLDTPKILGELGQSVGWSLLRVLDKELSSASNTSLAHRKSRAMTEEAILELRLQARAPRAPHALRESSPTWERRRDRAQWRGESASPG
jgi:SAM-dependent methyltransferase